MDIVVIISILILNLPRVVDFARLRHGDSLHCPKCDLYETDGRSDVYRPKGDPSARAFYYARVLEIPTPRWTAYDAAYFKIKITNPKVPMTTQERAFTSPIWYTP